MSTAGQYQARHARTPELPEIEQPPAVVEIRIPASAYAELTENERMFTVDGDRFIVTVDPDAAES